MWDAIRETYSDDEDSSQIFELKNHLWGIKQGEKRLPVIIRRFLISKKNIV